jgi:hypothetical protein
MEAKDIEGLVRWYRSGLQRVTPDCDLEDKGTKSILGFWTGNIDKLDEWNMWGTITDMRYNLASQPCNCGGNLRDFAIRK